MKPKDFSLSLPMLVHVARGFLMGGADIIPGVSGGTVALILGIYKRLVTAISRFDWHLVTLLRQRRWADAAGYVDLSFLVALGSGIVLGIGGLATLMHFLLQNYLQYTYAAFFGLILASSLLVSRMVERWSPLVVLWLIAAVVFAYQLVGALPAEPPPGNAYVFFSGTVAICAMILPGISGAFILLILGKYEDITGLLRSLLHGNFSTSSVITVAVFVTGCLVGLLCFSKLLRWLLSRYESPTMAVLCGFMVGSLREIWPFKEDMTPEVAEFKMKEFRNVWPDQFDGDVLFSLFLALLAMAFVFLLDRWTHGHEHVPSVDNERKRNEKAEIREPEVLDSE